MSDETVLAARTLLTMGSKVPAILLCKEMMKSGLPKGSCQLAIQRAMDAQYIAVEGDWTLSPSQPSQERT